MRLELNIPEGHVIIIASKKLIMPSGQISIPTILLSPEFKNSLQITCYNATEKEIALTQGTPISLMVISIKGNQELRVEVNKLKFKNKDAQGSYDISRAKDKLLHEHKIMSFKLQEAIGNKNKDSKIGRAHV